MATPFFAVLDPRATMRANAKFRKAENTFLKKRKALNFPRKREKQEKQKNNHGNYADHHRLLRNNVCVLLGYRDCVFYLQQNKIKEHGGGRQQARCKDAEAC